MKTQLNAFKLKPSVALISMAILATPLTAYSAEQDNAQEETEVIEIQGIRGSLIKALDRKRAAENIRDVINAEDIGKLPDKNIAEALQRVTGVQIGRSMGEGSEVSVRGISKNRVEVNGQTQPGAGAGRGVTFEELPAEMFESLEVIKSPTADETEGGLGAIVRLNTRKPLSQKGLVVSGSVEASYSDRSEETTPNGSLFVSNRWNLAKGKKIGALFNITHSKRKLRQDFFDTRGWKASDGWGLDLDGNGIVGEPMVKDENGNITSLNDAAFKPEQTRLQITLQDRTRTNYRAGFQFKPSKNSEWYLDTSYSESTNQDQQYGIAAGLNGRVPKRDYRSETVVISEAQTALAAFVGAIKKNGQGDRGTWININSNKNPNEREIYTFALSNKWQINQDLNMYTEFARGHGESFNDQMWGSSGVAFNNIPYLAYDFNAGTDIPTLIPYTNGADEINEENRLDLTDPLGYALSSITFLEEYEENDDTALKIDFDYSLEFGVINQFEFGVRLAKRTGERWRNSAKDTNDAGEDGILAGMTYEEIENLLPGSTNVMPFTNILDGATGDFPHSWISMNSEYLLNNSTEFKKAIGINMAFDQGWGFNVEEETQAIYVKANFDGMLDGIGINYSGNFGVRYIETEQTAVGAITGGDGAYTPYAQDNSYNNTLPSFNINLELADDLYLRLAGAKALARPAIADVAPITNIRFFSNSGSTGNTDLVPEIVTQFDASLEWYFNEGAIISAAIFKKDFKDTIEDGFLNRCFFIPSEYSSSALPNNVDCAADGSEALLGLKSKVNAGDAALKGIEIGYQQSFSQLPTPFDGLGVQANYTFTDSDILQTLATGFEAPLQDLSRNSYNAVVYYEKHGFTVRMAYNWRDDYYDKLTSSNSAEFAQPYGQLDTSINYKITPKWTIGLNVTNVTNEAEEKYQEIYERFLAYRVNDTRYALTLRGRL